MAHDNLEREARAAAALLRALANQRRLVVLCHLAAGERSVGELERLVGIGQSALSQHLARLRRAGVVDTRRAARTIFYRLAESPAEALLAALDGALAQRQRRDS